jgi:hypothetical protein
VTLDRTFPPPPGAAPPPRQLLAFTAIALAVHALLLFGLPHLHLKARAGDRGNAFVTRLVSTPAPAPAEPPAAPAPTAVPVPLPTPRTPTTRAAPTPAPKPAPRAPSVPPTAASPAPAETTPSDAPGAIAQGEPEPSVSLLMPAPLAQFGGTAAPAPIKPPLAASAAAAALKFARGAGDAPTRVAPAAEVHYRTVGRFGGQPVDIVTTLDWRQDGQAYQARWELATDRIGEHTRSATGLLAPQGLLPVEAAARNPEPQTLRFDYPNERVSLGASSDAPVRPGAQDRLSVLLQLGALLAGDARRYPVGTRIQLPAVHSHGLGRWQFTIEAEETITALQGQSLPTLRLVHQPEGDADARIEIWLGRTIHWLPVRLRITESNGDTVEHTMNTAYTQQVPPAPAPPQ